MIRFSLATLFVVVLLAGIGCAALIHANDLWRQIMVTATVTALIVAALAAAVSENQSRVFALGFALCGWIYLVLAFAPFGLRDDLLTDKAVAWLFATIQAKETDVQTVAFTSGGTLLTTTGQNGVVRLWDFSNGQGTNVGQPVKIKSFADIGHSLWVIVVAFLGGCEARLLAARNASVVNRGESG